MTTAQKIARMAQISGMYKRLNKRKKRPAMRMDKLWHESEKLMQSISADDKELYHEKLVKYILL